MSSKSVGIGCEMVTSESISICRLNLRMKLVIDSDSNIFMLLRFLRASCLSSRVTGAYIDLNFFRIDKPFFEGIPCNELLIEWDKLALRNDAKAWFTVGSIFVGSLG